MHKSATTVGFIVAMLVIPLLVYIGIIIGSHVEQKAEQCDENNNWCTCIDTR